MAASVLDTLRRTQGEDTTVAELRGWSRPLSRFLLHGPRLG
jgi:hypothetical protein